MELMSMGPHSIQKIEFARDILFLLGQNRARLALHARPEHEDVIEKLCEIVVAHANRFDRDAAARIKPKKVQAAKSGGILILLPDGLLENRNLDMSCFFRKLAGGDPFATISMQRVEKTYRKTAGTGQTG